MKKFIKITQRNEDGGILRIWTDQEQIDQLSQTIQQQGNNEATCIFLDGTMIELIAFNETLDSLN
jgi:predicted ATPase